MLIWLGFPWVLCFLTAGGVQLHAPPGGGVEGQQQGQGQLQEGAEETGDDLGAEPDQGVEGEAASDHEDVNSMHPLPLACLPVEGTEQHQQDIAAQGQQQQQQQQQAQARSILSLKNSEIRGGTVSCMSVFGSLSRLEAQGCVVGGSNFGCHTAKGAKAQLLGCEVMSDLAAVVVTGAGCDTSLREMVSNNSNNNSMHKGERTR